MKLYDWPTIEPFVMLPKEVEKISKKDITPISQVSRADWPEDAIVTLKKYPQLTEYGYLREIGGKPTFKVMVGTPGMTIR